MSAAKVQAAGASRRTGRAGRAGRLIRFATVGATGLVVNQTALWLFTDRLHIYYLFSAVLATQCSTLWNFAFTESWVFSASPEGRPRRFLLFLLLNNAWLLARAPLMYSLTDLLGINYMVSNFVALALATLARFAIADTAIWRPTVAAVATDPAIEREAIESVEGVSDDRSFFFFPLKARYYDVHGIVSIRSEAKLPELESFLVPSLRSIPDITITVGKGGFGGLRRRAAVTKDGEAISYVEHLGGAGFAMRIKPDGKTMRVRVSRLLKASPHVLYTNVVEPLLRWEMVKKGCILAHAACLEIDGAGVLISAQTDTGKTTTCLRSIRDEGSGFVSDDMVIISPNGIARSFPKPLTISAHTLKAASSRDLPWHSRLRLQLQGRLHSKSGRKVGLAMATRNLPVCTLNALVQMVVPPPKFHVRELLPDAQIVDRVPLAHMVVIEHGDALTEVLNEAVAVQLLADNTEDAYGFPPYPLIADLMANGASHEEAGIRRQIVARLSAVRLRSPDRSWYRVLSRIVAESRMEETSGQDQIVVVPDVVEELEGRPPAAAG